MKIRDKKTNFLLETISERINRNECPQIELTLNVDGTLIVGTVIGEVEFMKLPQNKEIYPLFLELLKYKEQYFYNNGTCIKPNITEEYLENMPDFLCQDTLYLKNAFYIVGEKFVPKKGTAIQVRISDISSFFVGRE